MSFLLKTILGVAAIEMALLMLLVVSSNRALTTSLEEEMEKRAETTLGLLDASFRDAILSSDLATLESVAKLVIDIPDVVYVRISGSEDEVLVESGSTEHRAEQTAPDDIDGDFHIATREVRVAGISYANLEVHMSMAAALAARADLQRTNLLIAVSELFLVALFSSALGFYLTRELQKLRTASSAVAAGELGVEIPVKGSDEIAETIRSFNRMSAALRLSKQDQEASEERLISVLDGLRDGVCLVDQQHRVRFLNNQARIYLDALAPGWKEEMRLDRLGEQRFSELLEWGYWRGSVDVEIEGLATWFDISVFEVAHASREEIQSQEWILTIQDVTEQRFREERDRQGEKLATVGQLAAGIAHDFNNVLGTITAVTDLYLIRPQSLPQEIQDDFETIRAQTKRASDLVKQILNFGRPEPVSSSELNLRFALGSIAELLGRTLPKTIDLSWDSGNDEVSVSFDDGAFEQVITNLILNAADAMPDGGTIQVRLSVRSGLQLRKSADPGRFERWACVEIEDDGEGISPAHLGRIFEPFFTTKERSKGTGLGLAQVLRIVHGQGGEIEVESQIGRGTKFTLFLQMDEPNQDLVPARRGESLNRSGQESEDPKKNRVLVVDDQPALLQTLEAMLENLGYSVLTAHDGAEAISIYDAHEEEIGLVLTDTVMPSIDGFELIARLREAGSRAGIILMSGHFSRNEVDIASVEAELSGFLRKPFGLAELRDALERASGDETQNAGDTRDDRTG